MHWCARSVAMVALAVLATGCASDQGRRGAGHSDKLTVYAASSLSRVLRQIDARPNYSFGGSNVLQLQIERGAPADLFLSASPREAQALHRRGLCERPQTITGNTLVLITRDGNPRRIGSVQDLRRGRLRLAVGGADVPIGAYTRRLLRRLQLTSVLRANRVSQASNAGQVLSQVALGGADAGLVYRSDALPQLRRIDLIAVAAWAQPAIRYEGCVVRRPGADGVGARRFLTTLRGPRAGALLRAAGFGQAATSSTTAPATSIAK